VASLDEDPEQNFVKKHSLKAFEEIKGEVEDEKIARRLSAARLFGPPAGEYGTKVIPLIETSNWKDEGDLAEVHIQSMNHVYMENVHAERVDKLYRSLLSEVDMVSQVRDSNDYEIVDLDHYYEFFGGLSKSVEKVKGEKPEMLVSDTTKEVIKTEEIASVIERGVRTRLLNPKWIDEMLKHDFHGAQQVADRVEYLLGLAATTNAVENWVWDKVAERYVFDEEMLRRLKENNKWALMEIMKRLLEAESRGYWEATREQIERLKETYLSIEGWIEESTSS
jgi:cobaltochelatase CobN